VDDWSAATANPALLATLTRSEVGGGFSNVGRDDFGALGGGGLVKRGVALGGYIRRPSIIDATSVGRHLEYELTEGAGLVALQRGPWAIGAAIRVARLAVTGEGSSQETDGPLHAGAGAGSTRLGGALGVSWTRSGVTLGVAFESAMNFEATRTSTLDGLTDDAGSTYDVRRPWHARLGAAFQGVSGGLYSEFSLRGAGQVRSELHRGPSDQAYTAEGSGFDAARAGAQYARALGSLSVILRAGVEHVAQGGIRYNGSNATEAGLFRGQEVKTRPTAGLGVLFGGGSIDVGVSTDSTVAVEGRVRF
jgi:hypothetical protein